MQFKKCHLLLMNRYNSMRNWNCMSTFNWIHNWFSFKSALWLILVHKCTYFVIWFDFLMGINFSTIISYYFPFKSCMFVNCFFWIRINFSTIISYYLPCPKWSFSDGWFCKPIVVGLTSSVFHVEWRIELLLYDIGE